MSAPVLTPLAGETIPSVAEEKTTSNTGRIVGIFGAMVVVLGGIGFGVAHFLRSSDPVIEAKPASSQGTSTTHAAKLTMPDPASAPATNAPVATATTTGQSGTRVPGIQLDDGDMKAIALRDRSDGTAANSQAGAAQRVWLDPDDAPIFSDGGSGRGNGSNSTAMSGTPSSAYSGSRQSQSSADPTAEANASLNALKGQLGGLMQSLQQRVSGGGAANAPTSTVAFGATQQPKAQLFGSMEQSATPRVSAHLLGDRSMVAAKGTLFLCSLKTRVVSATAGFIGCQTERNVFSDDGKVVLLERGSHLDGEYRVVDIKPGVTRVPVIWTRIRTSNGVVIDLDSPATGELGESGLGGYVDNRWGERLGAAILLSMVEDAIQYATTPKNASASTNVVLPNTTSQSSKLAETVLNTTINIPPLLYQNQGGVVGVYVARDLDFSSVYELRAKQAAR